MNRRLFLLAGLATLSGCVTPALEVATPAGATLGELEPLYAVSAGWRGVTITIATRGCARREDFTVHAEPRGAVYALAFARTRVETCNGPRSRARITFAWRDLRLPRSARFFVLNAVTDPVRVRPSR